MKNNMIFEVKVTEKHENHLKVSLVAFQSYFYNKKHRHLLKSEFDFFRDSRKNPDFRHMLQNIQNYDFTA